MTHLSSSHTSSASENEKEGPPKKLKELYRRAKELFDFSQWFAVCTQISVADKRSFKVAPQEYGIERQEKEEIGLLTSWPLLNKIEEDLKESTQNEQGHARFYFTKESHM